MIRRHFVAILVAIALAFPAHAGGPFVRVYQEAEAYTASLTTENLKVTQPFQGLEILKIAELTSGYGTAFTVSNEGHMMTCFHVVYCSTSIKARWQNTAERDAVLLVADPKADIAILKFPTTKAVRKAVFRETPVQVGEDIIAIGYPAKGGLTVTRGIVSRLDCGIPADELDGAVEKGDVTGLIQIDASINPGNSGGPVIDAEGRVIGMVTIVDTKSQGIAYCIPSTVLKKRYDEIMATKR